MSRVIVLGANGTVARHATTFLLRGAATAYRLTQKGEPFQGHDVALDALASLITHLVVAPELHVRASLGVSTS